MKILLDLHVSIVPFGLQSTRGDGMNLSSLLKSLKSLEFKKKYQNV